MQNAPIFKRRTFLQNFFGLPILLSATGLTLFSGCSSGSDNNYDPNTGMDTTGNCITNGTEINIQVNHTPNHTLFISKDDVNAGVQKIYTLENNGSGHTHTVTVSAADFATLRTNTSIQLTSTNNAGHTHTVAIGCA